MTVTLDISTEQATLMAQLFGLPVATQDDVSAIAQTFIARSCAEAQRRQAEAVRQALMADLQNATAEQLAQVAALLAPAPAEAPAQTP